MLVLRTVQVAGSKGLMRWQGKGRVGLTKLWRTGGGVNKATGWQGTGGIHTTKCMNHMVIQLKHRTSNVTCSFT